MHVTQMAVTAQKIIDSALGVRPGEVVVMITDTEASPNVTDVLSFAARAGGAVPVVVRMLPHEVGGQEPVPPVAAAIAHGDVVILQATYGLFHTEAVRYAIKAGARGADMWGVTDDMMVRGAVTADSRGVTRLTHAIQAVLACGREARLTTPEGTDVRIPLAGRPVQALLPEAREPGVFCAIPNGEAAIAPLEGLTEGVVIDPYMFERREIAFRQEPFTMEIRQGMVTSVRGGREARVVEQMLLAAGDSGRNIAEFALGTNAWARLGVTLREAKKCLGTVHIGLGDNRTLGGNVSSAFHMDMIFRKPTLTVDGTRVIEDGQVLIRPEPHP